MIYVEAPTQCLWADRVPSLFLAGTITGAEDWQQEFCQEIDDLDLLVLNPRRANFPMGDDLAGVQLIRWEVQHMHRARAIAFWFAKETVAPIAMFELGKYLFADKALFVAADPDFPRRFDLIHQLEYEAPNAKTAFLGEREDLVRAVRSWALGAE